MSPGRAQPVLVIDSATHQSRDVVEGSFPLAAGAPRHLRILLDWRIGYVEVRDVRTGDLVLSMVKDLPHVPVSVIAQPPLRVHERAPDRRACKAIGGT
jgi:hypothetical protein